jgi:U3 small nucleolar RNA-associated protein 14
VASSEISSWQDTISTNRSSKQVDLTQALPALPTLEQITTDLESSGFRAEVNKALGLKSEPLNQETNEEAGQRSKVRSDQFHEYQKQKRIAKIKSKLYHKIRNKRKDKTLMTHEEQAEDEDLKRIEERVSLRHSAAKLRKSFGRYAKDDGKIIISQNEALRQRIRNPSRVNSAGQLVYDSSSDEEFLAEQLGLEITENDSLMNMKFMQDAQKRQREKNDLNAETLLSDLNSSKFKFDGEADEKINKKQKRGENELEKGKKDLKGEKDLEGKKELKGKNNDERVLNGKDQKEGLEGN